MTVRIAFAFACLLALGACSKQAPSGDESASPAKAPAESTPPPTTPPPSTTAPPAPASTAAP